MKISWSDIVAKTILKAKYKGRDIPNRFSAYELAKGFRQLQISIRQQLVDIFLLSAGVLSAGFGLQGFLLPNHFIDGGAVGISLLIAHLSVFSFSLLLLLVNIPFIIIGFKVIGKEFAIKAGLSIVALSLAVVFIPYPQITHDKLLVAAFGGFFLGAGIGLAVRGGGVIDGTEILALLLGKRLGLTVGDIVMIINVIIFSFAAYFLSIEAALYSMLTYLAASKTVDFIIEGIEEYTGVTIVTIKSREIREMIIDKLGRGVTIYKGESGYGKHGHKNENVQIIYTVITRLEVRKLNEEIEKIDSNAFVVMNSIKEARGGMIKKRSFSHLANASKKKDLQK